MKLRRHALAALGAVVLAGCGSATAGPRVDGATALRQRFDQYPQYSVVLEDMRTDGGMSTEYQHKYRVIHTDPQTKALKETNTEWIPVSAPFYANHADNLGMTLLAKDADGSLDTIPAPAGFQYVGNPQYGQWQNDNSGNRFWVFFGQYAMLNALMGGGRVYGYDYDDYRRNKSRKPYYGRSGQYGTYGAVTRSTRPTFYERQTAAQASRRSTFEDRVNSRQQRSNMSGVRSRSGGYGK